MKQKIEPKISIAIATFNRKEVIEVTSKLFLKIKNINLRIYDDKSSEYDEKFLKSIYPYATNIICREKNLKADRNMYEIYKDFLKTDDEILVQLDSDMIIGKDFFNIVFDIASEILNTEAVYSLYNSNMHQFLENSEIKIISNETFRNKKHIGGACAIFTKKTIKKIIENIEIIEDDFSSYDWRWSKYLNENNIPIYVSENSYVQHIGFGGQNNLKIECLDIGYNFTGINDIDIGNYILKYYFSILKKERDFINKITFIEFLKIKIKNNKIIKQIYKKIKQK